MNTKPKLEVWSILSGLLALLAITGNVFGQGERGAITGVVKDSSGAVVPNAEVVALNKATGGESRAVSTDSGVYRLPYLTPATYTLSASVKGFKTAVRDNVEVRVAQTVTIDFTLELGEISERITVSAETPLLESSTSEIGTETTDKEFHTWPILVDDGLRQLQNFIFAAMPGTEGGTFLGSINGGQAYSHEIMIDGITLGRWDLTGGSNNEMSPSVDAASEFKLQTGNLSAQYGATQTAVANFGMKSGTNEVHGTVYWFHRDRYLRANSWGENANGLDRPPFLDNSFGGTIGGPLKKDRTHFFASYEGDRRKELNFSSVNATVPLPEFKTGDFSRILDPAFTDDPNSGKVVGKDALGRDIIYGQLYDPSSSRQLPNGTWVRDPFPGNIIPADKFSSISKNILQQADFPNPTFSTFQRNIPVVSGCCPNFRLDVGTLKIDHIINDKHKISGFFTYSKRERDNHDGSGFLPIPGPASSVWQRQKTPSRLFRFSEDWTISSTMLNHFGFGFNRFGNVNGSVVAGQDWAEKIGLTGVGTNTFPRVNFQAPSPALGDMGGTRMGVDYVNDSPNQSFVFVDDLTMIRRSHNVRVGAEIRRYHYNNRDLFGAGSYTFRNDETALPGFAGSTGFAYASFLLGTVDESHLSIPSTFQGQRMWYSAFYVQDDWKVKSNFTLNFGLRWELPGPLTEVADRMSSLDPNKPNSGADGYPGALVFLGNCQGCTGRRSFQDHYYKEFGPRFGFAWNAKPKMVVRGGYGINYSAPLQNGWGYSLDAGFVGSNPINANSGRFRQDPSLYWDQGYPPYTKPLPNYDPTLANGEDVSYLGPNTIRQPYTQNWSFGIQYELPWNTALETNYIGDKGTRLVNDFFKGALNQLDPRYLALGDALQDDISLHPDIPKPYPSFTGSVAQALRPFPQYFTVGDKRLNNGSSSYHALQVQVTKRTSVGLSFLAAYTFSKSLATTDTTINNYYVYAQNFYNLGGEKSVTTFHHPHNLKLSWIYDLPFGSGRRWAKSGLASYLIGGWTLSGIQNYRSGNPIWVHASAFDYNSYLFNPPGWRADVVLPPDQQKVSGSSGVDSANGTPYLNPAAFAAPPSTANGVALALGNAPRFLPNVRGPAWYDENFSIIKRIPLKFRESANFELRADIFNIFNRAGRGDPSHDFSDPSTFGRIFGVAHTTPRVVQVAARINF